LGNGAFSHDHQVQIYCVPEKLALADEQIVGILKRYVQTHLEKRGLPLGLVLLIAMRETFPCK